jgi:polar amino acid transport system substrate-binding protein
MAATWDPKIGRPGDDALDQFSPSGTVLRVGVVTTNLHIATKTGTKLVGPAIDISCRLATKLHLPLTFYDYPTIPAFLKAFRAGAFEIGWAVDPSLGAPDQVAANAYVGIPNTYVVRSGSSFASVNDLDKPGIRISVQIYNSTDLYLTAHLQFATLVRYPTSLAAAAAFVAAGSTFDATASGRAFLTDFVKTTPGVRILPDNIFFAELAPFMGPNQRRHGDAVCYLKNYIEAAKTSGLIAKALARITPPPVGSIVAPAKPRCCKNNNCDENDDQGDNDDINHCDENDQGDDNNGVSSDDGTQHGNGDINNDADHGGD